MESRKQKAARPPSVNFCFLLFAFSISPVPSRAILWFALLALSHRQAAFAIQLESIQQPARGFRGNVHLLSFLRWPFFFSSLRLRWSPFSLLFFFRPEAAPSWTSATRLVAFVVIAGALTWMTAAWRDGRRLFGATLSSIGDAVLVTDAAGRVTGVVFFLGGGFLELVGDSSSVSPGGGALWLQVADVDAEHVAG